jgi:hypothetical protein
MRKLQLQPFWLCMFSFSLLGWIGVAGFSSLEWKSMGGPGGSIYPLFSFACIGFGVVCFICFGIEDTDMSGGVNCSYIGL